MVRTPLQPGFSYIEWSAVIAGTVIACAITLVLTQFGSSLGFSIDALTADNDNLPEQFFTLGLWILWVQLLSSIAGGYAAGRLRAPWDAALPGHAPTPADTSAA